MKKGRSIATLVLLSAITLISCQKEVDDFNANPTPTPVSGDSVYLDKIFDLYDSGSGVDTQDVLIVSYDAQKRINGWISKDFNTGDTYMEYTYFYNGADSIPFKSVFLDYDSGGPIPDTITTFHNYDLSLRNIQDSSLISRSGQFQISITDYSYNADQKYGYTRNYVLTPVADTFYIRDTATLNAAGSILNSKQYRDEGTGYALSSTSAYTYDTHITPFAKQWIFKAHQNFPFGETLYWEYMPYNNITSQIEYIISSGPNPWIDYTVDYTYKSTGLPATAVEHYSPTDTETLIYTYKVL